MLELVRASALPSHQMMTASRGALNLPAEEMVEILVYIAEHNRIMGEQARLTLAGWDEASAKTIAANPDSSKEVLEYWVSPKNLRPPLFPLLLENPSISIGKLSELATSLQGEWIDLMIASPRVRASRQLLIDLSQNNKLNVMQASRLRELITGKSAAAEPQSIPDPQVAVAPAPEPVDSDSIPPDDAEPAVEAQAEPTAETQADAVSQASDTEADLEADSEADPEADEALIAFFTEHAAEIAAEGNKPFKPIGAIYEEMPREEPKAIAAAAGVGTAPSAPLAPSSPAVKPNLPKKLVNPEDEKRGSVLQKIAKLDIKGRIQMAMKGSKEERSILVRDGTKLVALAVLDSPKISDGEVEKIATQRNVLEAVLRAIPLKRRFIKNYAVVRNLVCNPRTPIDISLSLMKNLLLADLKNLAGNKEVSDTVRKLALRNFKQKTEHPNKS